MTEICARQSERDVQAAGFIHAMYHGMSSFPIFKVFSVFKITAPWF